MTTFTAKGLKVDADDGKLQIHKEGGVKKFVDNVFEITFSGDEAVKRGQNVLYVTERAVFRRTNKHGKRWKRKPPNDSRHSSFSFVLFSHCTLPS